jgi:hypothetical protein
MIRETDTDANGSRRSAVASGYLEDPYVGEFVADIGAEPAPRMPIINRGTAHPSSIKYPSFLPSFLSTSASYQAPIL